MAAPPWCPARSRVCPPPPRWTSTRPQPRASPWRTHRPRARPPASPRPQTQPPSLRGGRGHGTRSPLHLVKNRRRQDNLHHKQIIRVKMVGMKHRSRSRLLMRSPLNRGREFVAHPCEARGYWATTGDTRRTAPATPRTGRRRPPEVTSGDTHSGCPDLQTDTRSHSLSRPGPPTGLPPHPCLQVARAGEGRLFKYRATGLIEIII